jgi:hypothetical protein
MRTLVPALVLAAALCGSAGHAAAASPCAGEAPSVGETFRGPVLHVIDGERLCVARGFSPDQWVALRLADAEEAAGRSALMAGAFGQDVDCRITAKGPEGVQAICAVAGRSVAARAAEPTVRRAALRWR